MGKSDRQYFATLPKDELGNKLWEKTDGFYRSISESGYFNLVRKSYAMYNGATVNDTGAVSWALTKGGSQGELIYAVENHYRNIGTHLVNLITAQRPAVQTSAKNDDAKSIAQTILADAIVESYLTERGVEGHLKDAVETAVPMAEGYIFFPWETDLGEPYTENEMGGDERTGDTGFYTLGPIDIIRDENLSAWENFEWLIVRLYRNKYQVAAKYPEFENDILGLEAKQESKTRSLWGAHRKDCDLIPEYHFFHKNSPIPGLEMGRYVKFYSKDVVIDYGANPYQRHRNNIPLARVVCRKVFGSAFGATPMWDALGCQETINALSSAIITYELGRGLGVLTYPRQANVTIQKLAEAVNGVPYDGQQKPEVLQWPQTPAEFFNYKAQQITAMETIVGPNSVVRGNPSQNVGADASGSKLALIQAQALQANSYLEKAYQDLIRDVALGIIHNMQTFGGNVKRVLQLVGKGKQSFFREFTSDEIDSIDRVTVDVGNPLMRTIQGKQALADKAAEMGAIKDFNKYLLFMKTGNLDTVLEPTVTAEVNLKMENEAILDGKGHKPSIMDEHWKHIPYHFSNLDNPAARGDTPEAQAIQQYTLEAVQAHIDLFMQMPPWMVLLRGGQDAMALWQQLQSAMAPPVAIPGGVPPDAGPIPPGAPMPEQPVEGAPPGVPNMPQMPVNPATGERVDGELPPPAPPIA